MRHVAIVDIDTTLANNDHRATLLERTCVQCSTPIQGDRGQEKWPVCACGSIKYQAPQSSWDAFLQHDLMLKDTPQPHSAEVLNHMRALGWEIVFLTGRNEKHRAPTNQWLMDHMSARPGETLLMRPLDSRNIPASQMKEQLFLNWRDELGEAVQCIFFEDDRFVLGMWKKYGLVFLCPDAWETMNPVTHEPANESSWSR